MKSWIAAMAISATALLSVPAFGSTQTGPGTLDYFEGSASLAGNHLEQKSIGSATMQPGQVLKTASGRASIQLTPGSYLRVARNSSVKMVSSGILESKVKVLKGEAGVEVDKVRSNNAIAVVDHGVTTHLTKRGFYEFFASNPRVLVFSGEAQVETQPGNFTGVGKDHKLKLASHNENRRSFKASNVRDALFHWSEARHQYDKQNQEAYAGAGWRHPFWGRWDGPFWGWGPRWNWSFGLGWGPGFWGGSIF